VSDVEVQDLLRRHHAGEDVAVPLARSLRRSGRARDVVDLFGATRGPGPLREEAEQAWKETLRGLTRVAEWPEPAGQWLLRGWSGRRAVLLASDGARLLDTGRLALGRAWPTRSVCAGGSGMFVVAPRRFDPLAAAFDSVEVVTDQGATTTTLRTDFELRDASPDGAVLLATFAGALSRFVRLDDGAQLREVASSDVAWSWRHDRVAWGVQDRLLCARWSNDAPPVALGHVGRRLSFLEDGRLLIGQLDLRIIDVTTRHTVDVRGPRDLVGPALTSPDGQALLALRRSLEPVRLPLDARSGEAAAVADDWFTVRGVLQWHPQAEMALIDVRAGEAAVRHVDGEVLLRLPPDRAALGWTPDGRGLLAVRGSLPGPDEAATGTLELWAA
jgi:hypothetical protein